MRGAWGAKLFLAVLLVVCFGPSGYSQLSSGAVLGTVTDPSGAVIPGVAITVTHAHSSASAFLILLY